MKGYRITGKDVGFEVGLTGQMTLFYAKGTVFIPEANLCVSPRGSLTTITDEEYSLVVESTWNSREKIKDGRKAFCNMLENFDTSSICFCANSLL